MYAMGKPSPQKEVCLALFQKINQGESKAASSVEVLQEILHRYRSIQKFLEGIKVYDLFRALPLQWLDVTLQDVDLARSLLDENRRLSSRDALHLAMMQRHKIEKIVSYDKGFLGLKGITVCLPDQI